MSNLAKIERDNLQNVPSHTFVMFYMTGCIHCVAIEPAWLNIAKAYQKHKGVLICAIESTQASHVNPDILGYPTFCHYHNGVLKSTFHHTLRTETTLKQWIRGSLRSKKTGKNRGKKHSIKKTRRYRM